MKKHYLLLLAVLLTVLPSPAQEQQGTLTPELHPVYQQLKYHSYLWNPALAISDKGDSYFGLYHRNSAFAAKDNPERYFVGYNGQLGERSAVALALVHDREGIIDLNSIQGAYAYELWLTSEVRMALGLQATFRMSGLALGRAIATIDTDPSLDQEPTTLFAVNPGLALSWRRTRLGLSFTNLASFEQVAGEGELFTSYCSFNAQLAHAFELGSRGESTLEVQAYTQQREWGDPSFGLTGLYERPGLGWAQGGYDNLYGLHAGLGVSVLPSVDVFYTFENGGGELAQVTSTHGIGLSWHFEPANPRATAPAPRVKAAKPAREPKVKKEKPQKVPRKVDGSEVERLREELEEAKNTITIQREEINLFATENDSLKNELAKLRRELNILKNQRVTNQNSAGLGDNTQITTLQLPAVKQGYYLVLSTYKDLKAVEKAMKQYTRMGVETNWFIDKSTKTYYLFWKRFSNKESAMETLQIINESDYKDEAWIVRIESN